MDWSCELTRRVLFVKDEDGETRRLVLRTLHLSNGQDDDALPNTYRVTIRRDKYCVKYLPKEKVLHKLVLRPDGHIRHVYTEGAKYKRLDTMDAPTFVRWLVRQGTVEALKLLT